MTRVDGETLSQARGVLRSHVTPAPPPSPVTWTSASSVPAQMVPTSSERERRGDGRRGEASWRRWTRRECSRVLRGARAKSRPPPPRFSAVHGLPEHVVAKGACRIGRMERRGTERSMREPRAESFGARCSGSCRVRRRSERRALHRRRDGAVRRHVGTSSAPTPIESRKEIGRRSRGRRPDGAARLLPSVDRVGNWSCRRHVVELRRALVVPGARGPAAVHRDRVAPRSAVSMMSGFSGLIETR